MAEQSERVRQALEHPCPRCKAPAGIGCSRPSGSMLASHTVHAAREDVAARVRDDDGPPSDITTNAGRAIWRSGMNSLREAGQVTPQAQRILLSAIRWTEEAENALEQASTSPMVIGSTGQDVANPLFGIAARAQERALAAFRTLLLTPDSRIAAPAGGHHDPQTGDELDDLDREAAGAGRRRGG